MNQVISNTTRIKQINVDLVKGALIESTYGTKQSISQATGLSVATCGNILNELLESGEVIEVDLDQPSGGRPARRFMYNANFYFVASIYLSYEEEINKITYAVTNLIGEIIEEDTLVVDSISYKSLEDLIDHLVTKYEIINALGIGIPALVDDGNIIGECDINDLSDFPLGTVLNEKFPMKIIVENDMNLKALGFYRKQNYEKSKSLAVINFPKDRCIGSGIIVDGHVIKGSTNFAGELSYLPLDIPQGKLTDALNKPENLLQIVGGIITSINAVINPATVVLTGDLIKNDILQRIYNECLKVTPKKHIPEIIIRENIHDDYINGLVSVTIESLTCEVQMVKKRIC